MATRQSQIYTTLVLGAGLVVSLAPQAQSSISSACSIQEKLHAIRIAVQDNSIALIAHDGEPVQVAHSSPPFADK
jgi:hypothetical protein